MSQCLEVDPLKVIYPFLYGIYLALGLLALQPYQDPGFSPLGAAFLLILGGGLSTFLLSVGALPMAMRLEGKSIARIFSLTLVQAGGLCAFVTGMLSGAGFVFAISALLYGTIAGTVWSRFVRSRPGAGWARFGVALASLTVCLSAAIDWGRVLEADSMFPALAPQVIIVRSLCLAGALLWGVGHFGFDARSFPASRSVWNVWQSIFSVSTVLVLGLVARLAPVPFDLVSQGFAQDPILVTPFLLFGVVFGTLRSRLVHAWESRLSSRRVQFAWVLGAVSSASCGGLLLIPGERVIPELMALAIIGFCIFLMRHQSLGVSDYRGPQRVPAYAMGS
jgi:hypothetical protein